MDLDQDPAVDWLVRDMRSHLRKRAKRYQLSDAGFYAYDLYETNTASMPTYDLACKAGCGSCCAAHVGVEVAEAFAIMRHLQQSRTPDDFAALMARVAEIAAEVGDLDPGTRWVKQVFCAFLDLDSQSCSIYAVRPTIAPSPGRSYGAHDRPGRYDRSRRTAQRPRRRQPRRKRIGVVARAQAFIMTQFAFRMTGD